MLRKARLQRPFRSADQELAGFAKALAHPARIAILRLLADQGPQLCKDIVSSLPLSQSTCSQHIRALMDAGLLQVEAEGPAMRYRLDRSHIRSFCHAFQETLRPAAEEPPAPCSA